MCRRVEGNTMSSTCEGSVFCKINRIDGSSPLLIRMCTTPYILSEEWLNDCHNGKLPHWINCRFAIKPVVSPSVLIPSIFLPFIGMWFRPVKKRARLESGRFLRDPTLAYLVIRSACTIAPFTHYARITHCFICRRRGMGDATLQYTLKKLEIQQVYAAPLPHAN